MTRLGGRAPREFNLFPSVTAEGIKFKRPEGAPINGEKQFQGWAIHVAWDLGSPGGSRGTIIKMPTSEVGYKGYTHHASRDEPQYEIKSDKSDHIAMHKGSALRKVRR